MTDTVSKFGVVDYVVLCGMISLSVGIGIYHACVGGKQRTTEEFLLANRNMNPIPVGLSIGASFVSSLTVIGIPGDVYIHGIDWCLNIVGVVAAGVIVCRLFIPFFFRLNLTSAYEYFELRFNKYVRLCALVSFMVLMNLYMGVVMYGPSIALNVVTGLSLWGSVIATGLVCTLYTSIGGMKAVLWTDAFQVVFMIAGLLAALIEGLRRVGSVENVWNIAAANDRLKFSLSADPTMRHTVWLLSFGSIIFWCQIICANQTQIQRYLTLKTEQRAKIAVCIGVLAISLMFAIACLAGVTIFAYYNGCDPLSMGLIQSRDQVILYFIMDVFANLPGLPGVFVAAIFGATLSTVSSGLNSLAAVTLHDIVKSFYADLSEDTTTKLSKLFALLYGVFAILVAYVISLFGAGLVKFGLTSFGLIGGPILGLFCLGIFFPGANSKGALAGFLIGMSFASWIVIGAIVHPNSGSLPPLSAEECIGEFINSTTTEMSPTTIVENITPSARPMITKLYTLSYTLYACIGCFTTIFVGLIVSVITGGNKPGDVDPKLLNSLADALGCCFPESCKKMLQCGKSHDGSESDKQINIHKVELEEKGTSSLDGNTNKVVDVD